MLNETAARLGAIMEIVTIHTQPSSPLSLTLVFPTLL
jgi:hypothetical protein